MGTSVHSKCAHVKATLETTPLYQMAVTVAEPMLALVGLNHGPPPIGSDALVNSPNPAIKDDAAVQEANAIKQQEDAAPAKIAAIKYLAGVDCKCYLGVKPALLKALIDCNEGVRFEAAKALGSACCCDKEVAQILDKRANGRDDFGNYIEWSPRVRAAAAQSAAACAGLIPPNGEIDGGRVEPPPIEPPPIEPPPRPQAKRGLFQRDQQEVVIASQPAPTVVPQKTEKRDSPSLVFDRTRLTSTPEKKPETPAKTKVEASPQVVLRHDIAKSEVVPASRGIAVPASSTYKETPSSPATKPAVHLESIESKEDAVNTDLMGMVTYVDTKTGSVRLSFTEGEQPRAGLRAEVFHKFLLRTQHIGELEIIGSSEGAILARPTGELTIRQLSKGDRVVIHQ
jgi:hypothetical protein